MPRSLTIDLARGFTVLMIAPIHTLLVYSQPYVAETLIGKLLAFVAEWHGAQIFMLLMGISITFKDPQPLQTILKRSGILLLAAYLLNVLKFIIPYCFHFLPPGILDVLGIDRLDPDSHPVLHMLLTGDILHFAAMAYIIVAILYNRSNFAKIALIAATVLTFLSPLFYDAGSCSPFINYILNLFTGQPPQTFFPVFPWLVYPLLGLWFGSLLKKEKPWIALDSLWLIGAAILVIALPLKYFLHDRDLSIFYRTRPLDTGLHMAAIFIFLSGWHWISKNVKSNAVFQLFQFGSRNITLIYLIQWVLILWLSPVFGFHHLGWFTSIMAMAATSLVTLSLCLLFKMAFKS